MAEERFADIQLIRYQLTGFEKLTLRQKTYIYYLSKAALAGRDVVTDQHCRHNLAVRKTLEAIVKQENGNSNRNDKEFNALTTYLRQIWFANGIHHHYSCEKFTPLFTEEYLRQCIEHLPEEELPTNEGEDRKAFSDRIVHVVFDKTYLAKRVNLNEGEDLVITSACNFYEGLTQQEAEAFYAELKNNGDKECPVSYGLNSKLVKQDGVIREMKWTATGLYGEAIRHIIEYLLEARKYTENKQQEKIIDLLVSYYQTGDLKTFDDYSIEWLKETEGQVDFINGFIEVYGDPLGVKASWEGLVEYKDIDATKRTKTISENAQWFEDQSPIDRRFKKESVTGVTASVICAAMLGGDEYPASAIGINLPNADWIRAQHGSKSITIGNLTDAYKQEAANNGFYEEFIDDCQLRDFIKHYGPLCDNIHTDLHECLGHGSGKILPGTDPDALKAYGSTIEEARADLFAMYFIADKKLVELGILPNSEAYKAQYYTYLLNGLLTQNVRIKPGKNLEEAHMRNRALIANWIYTHANGDVALEKTSQGKTFLRIRNYDTVRKLAAQLLAQIQQIKSMGLYEEARKLVETYAVKIDRGQHIEVLARYEKLQIAPYKGFINPRMTPVTDSKGNITDIIIDYSETYDQQMMRYSVEYGYL